MTNSKPGHVASKSGKKKKKSSTNSNPIQSQSPPSVSRLPRPRSNASETSEPPRSVLGRTEDPIPPPPPPPQPRGRRGDDGCNGETSSDGGFPSDQSLIYNAVLNAHNSVISAMKLGVNWVDMHKLAERIILESLKKGSIFTGDDGRTFGCCFHASWTRSLHEGVERPKEPGLKSLRTARYLLKGMVGTNCFK